MVPHASVDSNLELDNGTIEEAFDEEVLDPDFLLYLLDDDLTLTVSGMHAECTKTNVLEVPVFCLGSDI